MSRALNKKGVKFLEIYIIFNNYQWLVAPKQFLACIQDDVGSSLSIYTTMIVYVCTTINYVCKTSIIKRFWNKWIINNQNYFIKWIQKYLPCIRTKTFDNICNGCYLFKERYRFSILCACRLVWVHGGGRYERKWRHSK